MRDSVGLFCKSFSGDFKPLAYMLETFGRHNPAELLLTLSLPSGDIKPFEAIFGQQIKNVKIVADESYSEADLTRCSGWFGQQVCKLQSWRTMACEHYLVLDSDCYFLRDIHRGDVLPRAGKPYVACGSTLRTVLNEQNLDLLKYLYGELDPRVYAVPQEPKKSVDRLDEFRDYLELYPSKTNPLQRSDIAFKTFGRKRWIYFQPGQIFSKALLRKLLEYFGRHGLSTGQAIQICPWEYNWYGEYAASQHFEDTDFKISPFLHFQKNSDVDFARRRGITAEKIKSKFLLIQMAARHVDALWL
ncbi:MAG: DUF6492 family protein [Steroidobacteraceae bacterium]